MKPLPEALVAVGVAGALYASSLVFTGERFIVPMLVTGGLLALGLAAALRRGWVAMLAVLGVGLALVAFFWNFPCGGVRCGDLYSLPAVFVVILAGGSMLAGALLGTVARALVVAIWEGRKAA